MAHLSFDVVDSIATITFDNPPLSVITPKTIHELQDLFPRAPRSPLAVAHIKRLAREAVSPVTKEMLTLESRLFVELMQTEEAKKLLAGIAKQHRIERAPTA